MMDNELILVFLPIIQNGLIARGYTDVSVVQSNQPTQEGVTTSPGVFFFKVGDRRIGFPERTNGNTVLRYDFSNKRVGETGSRSNRLYRFGFSKRRFIDYAER